MGEFRSSPLAEIAADEERSGGYRSSPLAEIEGEKEAAKSALAGANVSRSILDTSGNAVSDAALKRFYLAAGGYLKREWNFDAGADGEGHTDRDFDREDVLDLIVQTFGEERAARILANDKAVGVAARAEADFNSWLVYQEVRGDTDQKFVGESDDEFAKRVRKSYSSAIRGDPEGYLKQTSYSRAQDAHEWFKRHRIQELAMANAKFGMTLKPIVKAAARLFGGDDAAKFVDDSIDMMGEGGGAFRGRANAWHQMENSSYLGKRFILGMNVMEVTRALTTDLLLYKGAGAPGEAASSAAGKMVTNMASFGAMSGTQSYGEGGSFAEGAIHGVLFAGLTPAIQGTLRAELGFVPEMGRSIIAHSLGMAGGAYGATTMTGGKATWEGAARDALLGVLFGAADITGSSLERGSRGLIEQVARGQVRKVKLKQAKADRARRFTAREELAKQGSERIRSAEAEAMEGVGDAGPAGVELREAATDIDALEGDRLAEEYTHQTGKSATLDERPLSAKAQKRAILKKLGEKAKEKGKKVSAQARGTVNKLKGEELAEAHRKIVGEEPVLPERPRSEQDMRSELQQRKDRSIPKAEEKRLEDEKRRADAESVAKLLKDMTDEEVQEVWEDEVLAKEMEERKAQLSEEDQARYDEEVEDLAQQHTAEQMKNAIYTGRSLLDPEELLKQNARAINLGIPLPNAIPITDAPMPEQAPRTDFPDHVIEREPRTREQMIEDILRVSFGDEIFPEGTVPEEPAEEFGEGGVYIAAGGGQAESVPEARKRAASVKQPEPKPKAESPKHLREDRRISEYLNDLPTITLRRMYKKLRGDDAGKPGDDKKADRRLYLMALSEEMGREARKPGYKSPFGYHEGGIRLKSEAPARSKSDQAKVDLMARLMKMDIVQLQTDFMVAGGKIGRDEAGEQYRQKMANFLFAKEAERLGLNEPTPSQLAREAKRKETAERIAAEESIEQAAPEGETEEEPVDHVAETMKVVNKVTPNAYTNSQRGALDLTIGIELGKLTAQGGTVLAKKTAEAALEASREVKWFASMLHRTAQIADGMIGKARETAKRFARVAYQTNADASVFEGGMSEAAKAVKKLTGKLAGPLARATREIQRPIRAAGKAYYKLPWVEMVEGRMEPRNAAEAKIIEAIRKLIAKRGELAKSIGVEGFDMPEGREGHVVPRDFSAEFMEVLRAGPDGFDKGRSWRESVDAWSDATGQSHEYIERHFMSMHEAYAKGSHSSVVKAQFEFSRDPKLREIPHGIRAGTRHIRFIEDGIFDYTNQFVRGGSSRLSVLKNLPDERIAEFRKAFTGEQNEKHFNDMIRGLSGMAIQRRIIDPNSTLGSIMRGAGQAWRIWEGAIISARTWRNAVELAGSPLDAGGPKMWAKTVWDTTFARFGKGKEFVDEQLGMDLAQSSMLEMLEELGAVTADIRNWGFNPNRSWESATRIGREGVEIAALGARFLEQYQEHFAAALGRNMTRAWFSRKGTGWKPKSALSRSRYKADIRTVESMGFEREAATRMVNGEGTIDEYRQFVISMPKRLVSANSRTVDVAKIQSDPTWRSVMRLTRWPINNVRRLGTELLQFKHRVVENGEELRSGKITKKQQWSDNLLGFGRLAGIAGNRAVVGALGYSLWAVVNGKGRYISDDIDEKGVTKFMGEMALDTMFGAQGRAAMDVLDTSSRGKGALEAFSLPVSKSIELWHLAAGTGAYRSLDPLTAIDKFMRRQLPMMRAPETLLYAAGVLNEDAQRLQQAHSRFYQLINRNDLFEADRGDSHATDYPEYARGMKMASLAMQHREPMSVVYGYINRALKLGGMPPSKAASTLLQRRKLAKYTGWNKRKSDGSYEKPAVVRKVLRDKLEFLKKSSDYEIWVREDKRLERLAAAMTRRGKD